jgi:hypothetical protein
MSKSVKMSFNVHKHIHPHIIVEAIHRRVIVEASIKLTGSAPVQDFIVNLQELLKNGQLVDKMFDFCPIDPDGTDKKIHEVSGIQTNMTILGAHFKILSNSKNPFEKQKQWKKTKKDKEEFRDPIVYFFAGNCYGQRPRRSPLMNHSRVAVSWWYFTMGQGT